MKTPMPAAAALLLLIAASAFANPPDNDETPLLQGLSPGAQKFFQRSAEVRAGYAETDAYRHFLRDRDGDGKIDVMDRDGYLHLQTGFNGYVANPALYGGAPTSSPAVFYRYVRDCRTKETLERQVIVTDHNYLNYIGGDRYEQQCVLDGTPDEYYVESLQKLEPDDGSTS